MYFRYYYSTKINYLTRLVATIFQLGALGQMGKRFSDQRHALELQVGPAEAIR